jgi:outer membrane protein assembly factor BamB
VRKDLHSLAWWRVSAVPFIPWRFNMKKVLLLCLLLCVGCSLQTNNGADWPQWRGPQRDGISEETGLLQAWPAEGPELLWQVNDIGDGYSTPAVVGSRLYIISNRGMENEFVQALSVEDGTTIWTSPLGKVGNPDQQPNFPMARSTPTVDGEFLYALGSDGDLVCLEKDTGEILWQKSLREDFGGVPGTWAYSESPLVDGDAVIVTPGGAQATLVALNKKNGEVIWTCAVPEGDAAGYASAIVIQAAGRRQYVQFLEKGVVGVDAGSGRFLWRYEEPGKSPANIPTPVAGGDYVYASKARVGGGLVHLKPVDDGVAAEEVYFIRDLPYSIGGAILTGDYLYGTTDMGMVAAEFLSGEIKWQAEGIGVGSILLADGCLYVHGENGEMALVEATPEGYREKGRFTPPNQPEHNQEMEKSWAYPVISNGRLYIRDLGTLWCYDIKAANP